MARPEIIEEPTEKKSHFWLILFFVFVGIFMFIFFTTFYEEGMNIPLTGNVIKTNKTVGEIIVNGDLNIPASLPINSGMKTLGIKIKGPVLITIGNQEIHLNTLSYSATGILKINDCKFLINLVEEEFYVNDFVGDLEINKNYLRINGNARDFDANKILENK